jgi:hypothetical protein
MTSDSPSVDVGVVGVVGVSQSLPQNTMRPENNSQVHKNAQKNNDSGVYARALEKPHKPHKPHTQKGSVADASTETKGLAAEEAEWTL